MSCRTTAAGSAATTMARLDNPNLSDVQVLSLFHEVRGRESTLVATERFGPTSDEEWGRLCDREIRLLREGGDQIDRHMVPATYRDLTPARRASLIARWERARGERPDERTIVAIRELNNRARRADRAMENQFGRIGRPYGLTAEDVREQYRQAEREVPRTRGSLPEGYSDEAQQQMRFEGLPADRGTFEALRQTRAWARSEGARRASEGIQRITRRPMNSTAIREAGYDPSDGRLEVVFNRPGSDGESRVYAYRGVPQEVWDEMQSGSAGEVYTREVRNNRDYSYQDAEEAALQGRARRCVYCGQFKSNDHYCEARERQQAAARERETALDREREAAAQFRAEQNGGTDPLEGRPELRTYDERSARDRFPNRSRGRWSVASYDRLVMPQVTELRRMAADGPVAFPVSYMFVRRTAEAEGEGGVTADWGVTVSGEMILDRPQRGQWAVMRQRLRCTCGRFRSEGGTCEHLAYVERHVTEAAVPNSNNSQSAMTDARREEIRAAHERAAQEARERDWSTDPELMRKQNRRVPMRAADRLSTHFDKFEEMHTEALAEKAAGEPVPFMRENATNGLCTPESGRGFGVELEFDLPAGGRAEALAAIGRELHEAGLTRSARQDYYHAADRRGYTDQHQGGWSYEQDCTVSGEIVSPIMYDTPETWENVAKVCDIITRHGGKATARTGSHVHVSSPNTTAAQATDLLRTTKRFEDVLYRMSANPMGTGKHRKMQWCGPNREAPASGYQNIGRSAGYGDNVTYAASGHNYGVNLQSVHGGEKDHAEIRFWDGSLDPGTIQAQVKMSAALVASSQSATRREADDLTRRAEPVGSHDVRMKALLGRSRRALTSDELKEDSGTARAFMDVVASQLRNEDGSVRREDQKQLVRLFASTKWMAKSTR